MRSIHLGTWLAGLALAAPATGAPEVWVGTITAHIIACTTASVDRSDPEAVTQASQAFLNRWPGERLVDLGAIFGADADTPDGTIFCAQYFGGDAPLPEGLVRRSAPASPGLFAYCQPSETEACLTRLAELLGDTWHGQRWSRWRFDWVKPGAEAPETITAHADLERLATEPDSLKTLPDPESDLQPVGQLTVARLTEEDAKRIQAALTQPPAAPAPEGAPPPPEEIP